jgi:hypothetical protein
MRGPSVPFRQTVHDTKVCLGQKLCKTRIHTTTYPEEKGAPYETKLGLSGIRRGPSARLKTRKNPNVMGLVKCIFSVLADRLGCTAAPSAIALSDI